MMGCKHQTTSIMSRPFMRTMLWHRGQSKQARCFELSKLRCEIFWRKIFADFPKNLCPIGLDVTRFFADSAKKQTHEENRGGVIQREHCCYSVSRRTTAVSEAGETRSNTFIWADFAITFYAKGLSSFLYANSRLAQPSLIRSVICLYCLGDEPLLLRKNLTNSDY